MTDWWWTLWQCGTDGEGDGCGRRRLPAAGVVFFGFEFAWCSRLTAKRQLPAGIGSFQYEMDAEGLPSAIRPVVRDGFNKQANTEPDD